MSTNKPQEKPDQPDTSAGDNGYVTAYTEITGFLSIIIRNLWIIILVGVIGGVTAFFVVNAQTEIFETQTSLVVLPNNDEDIPKPLEDVDIALGTYIQVLRSRKLANEVLVRLEDTYSSNSINAVSLDVRPVENSTIIVITVQAESSKLARSYANEMTALLTQENPLPLLEVSYPVDVLDSAYLPASPSYPDIAKTIILATIGSLIVGVLVAFLRDTYSKKS